MPEKYHAIEEVSAREKDFKDFIKMNLEAMSVLKREAAAFGTAELF